MSNPLPSPQSPQSPPQVPIQSLSCNNYLWKTVVSYKMSELLEIVRDRYPNDLKDEHIKEIVENIRKRLIISAPLAVEAKHPPSKKRSRRCAVLPPEERCVARCWVSTDINGKQCSRRYKNSESKLCKNHEANLPHGRITDPITKHLKANFRKNRKKLDKTPDKTK